MYMYIHYISKHFYRVVTLYTLNIIVKKVNMKMITGVTQIHFTSKIKCIAK